MQSTDLHIINQALERIADALESQPRICPSNWEHVAGNRWHCRDCGREFDGGILDYSLGIAVLTTLHSTQHYRFD